jgi:hypothetical protein
MVVPRFPFARYMGQWVHGRRHGHGVLRLDDEEEFYYDGEHSALRRNMPQRNDDEGGKSTCISFSPASSVWGLFVGVVWM